MEPRTRRYQTYDYIIVGGGPSGSVIASKLSEDPNLRVLLVEAGDATQRSLGGQNIYMNSTYTLFDIPFLWSKVAQVEEYHWNIRDALVAKGLGGCGIHNAMLYVRALPDDLAKWNQPKIWPWNDVLKTYIDAENFTSNSLKKVPYHGYNGKIQTSLPHPIDTLAYQFMEACEENQIPYTQDFNDPNIHANGSGRVGVGFYHFNIRNGIRDSAAKAFLTPKKQSKEFSNSNLHILLNSTVEKILIQSKIAIGIDIKNLGRIGLNPQGEVIVTAGAINTPRLLMASGIGSSIELQNNGIPVIQNLPGVGKNLQDHPAIALMYDTYDDYSIEELNLDPNVWNFYTKSQNGSLASPGLSVGAFLIPPGSTRPEIQLTLFSTSYSEPHVEQQFVHHSKSMKFKKRITITIALLTPEARNRIQIYATNNKSVPTFSNLNISILPQGPEFDSEYLSSLDAMKLLWGVHAVMDITRILQNKQILRKRVYPSKKLVRTDEQWKKWIHETAYRNSHWVGSARMNTINSSKDGNAVVDGHLNVLGLKQIRIADASIIPIIPNGNVHSTVVMVASRAAKFILSKRKNSTISHKTSDIN